MISDSQLLLMLEYWFPFELIPITRKRGTWCDGVSFAAIHLMNRTSFAIAGVGYFPHELNAFELEFHYQSRRDLFTKKIVLRFGILDASGRLRAFRAATSPNEMLALRPRDIRQWAVAVELSPET